MENGKWEGSSTSTPFDKLRVTRGVGRRESLVGRRDDKKKCVHIAPRLKAKGASRGSRKPEEESRQITYPLKFLLFFDFKKQL
jgi:hypothetical protein